MSLIAPWKAQRYPRKRKQVDLRLNDNVIEFVWLAVQPGLYAMEYLIWEYGYGCSPGYAFELELGLGSSKPCERLVRRERWKVDGNGVDLADDFSCHVTLVVVTNAMWLCSLIGQTSIEIERDVRVTHECRTFAVQSFLLVHYVCLSQDCLTSSLLP